MRRRSSKAMPNYLFGVPFRVGIPSIGYIKRHERTSAEPPLPLHRHGSHLMEFIYLAKGQQTHVVAGRRWHTKGGDVLVIRPGETHSSGGAPQEKVLMYWVGVNIPSSRERFLNLPPNQSHTLLSSLLKIRQRIIAGSPRMQAHLDAALTDLLDYMRDPLDPVRIQSNIVLFLTEVVACSVRQQTRRMDPWVEKALDHINGRANEPLTVCQLASHMGLSRSRLTLRFKKELGVPPGQYILRTKVEAAKNLLLRDPRRTITDIALTLGFSSSQYFGTVFRRFTGMTARKFREEHPSRPTGA